MISSLIATNSMETKAEQELTIDLIVNYSTTIETTIRIRGYDVGETEGGDATDQS